MPGLPWKDRAGRLVRRPPVVKPGLLPRRVPAEVVVSTGTIRVRVMDPMAIPSPLPIEGNLVTVGGVSTPTDVNGYSVFAGIAAGTGKSAVVGEPPNHTWTWTSSQGTASGSGETATGITVTAGQTTEVQFDRGGIDIG